MTHHRGKERLSELQGKGENVGKYLYQSCRCAIAHAGDPRNPVIDPHNPEDQKRLHSDLPLVISLAEIAIEKLGIQTSKTVYEEHRYELSGFEKLLAPELVQLLKEGGSPVDGEIDLPESLSLRIWGRELYTPLEDMKAEAVYTEKGLFSIKCKSIAQGYFVNLLSSR